MSLAWPRRRDWNAAFRLPDVRRECDVGYPEPLRMGGPFGSVNAALLLTRSSCALTRRSHGQISGLILCKCPPANRPRTGNVRIVSGGRAILPLPLGEGRGEGKNQCSLPRRRTTPGTVNLRGSSMDSPCHFLFR